MAKIKKGTTRQREFIELIQSCAEVSQNTLKQLEKKLEVAAAFAGSDEIKDILISFREDLRVANLGIKNSINYAIMAKQSDAPNS